MPAGYWRFLPSFRDDYISLDKMTLGNYLGVCAVIYLTLEEVRLSKTRGHPRDAGLASISSTPGRPPAKTRDQYM